jgi:hypothetical protein
MTLEEVNRDSIHSREDIKASIERHLARPNAARYTAQISEAKQSLTQVQTSLQTQRKRIQIGITLYLFVSDFSSQESSIPPNIYSIAQRSHAQGSPISSPKSKPPSRSTTNPRRTKINSSRISAISSSPTTQNLSRSARHLSD